METNNFNIENIEELKKMQKEKYLGWSKHLIPYCSKYFDANLSLKFIQQKLKELYEMNVSVDTLSVMRMKYKKEENISATQKSIPILSNTISTSEKKEDKPGTAPLNNGKLSPQEREEKNKLLENAIKNMADFDNRPAGERTELDDLIDKHQQLKSKG